jgi:hypothetical protein
MRAAKLRHQGNPQLAVVFEFPEFAWVEYIADMAGDHGGLSMIGVATLNGFVDVGGSVGADGGRLLQNFFKVL